MAKNEKAKKIPGWIIVIVVVIIAVIAFIPTVYMPYKNKKPTMDAEHQEALDTLAYLDQSIENQAAIEADIAQLKAQWEQYRKDMFVEPESALNDLNSELTKNDMDVKSFVMHDPVMDESGTVTAEGNPLCYSVISLNCTATREQLIDFLQYVEQESVGAYYVKTLYSTTVSEYSSDSDKSSEIIGEKLDTQAEIYLYFFDQNQVIVPETDTEEESTDAA